MTPLPLLSRSCVQGEPGGGGDCHLDGAVALDEHRGPRELLVLPDKEVVAPLAQPLPHHVPTKRVYQAWCGGAAERKGAVITIRPRLLLLLLCCCSCCCCCYARSATSGEGAGRCVVVHDLRGGCREGAGGRQSSGPSSSLASIREAKEPSRGEGRCGQREDRGCCRSSRTPWLIPGEELARREAYQTRSLGMAGSANHSKRTRWRRAASGRWD